MSIWQVGAVRMCCNAYLSMMEQLASFALAWFGLSPESHAPSKHTDTACDDEPLKPSSSHRSTPCALLPCEDTVIYPETLQTQDFGWIPASSRPNTLRVASQ